MLLAYQTLCKFAQLFTAGTGGRTLFSYRSPFRENNKRVHDILPARWIARKKLPPGPVFPTASAESSNIAACGEVLEWPNRAAC